jgi:hypothetical protein
MTAAQAQDIARFLDYVAGDGQREGTLTPGYVALTDELRAQTLAARDAVLVGAATPTPAPSPAPVDPAFETVDAGFLDPSFVPGLISDVGLDAAALEAAVGAPLNATAASESTSRSGGLKGLLRALTGSGARYVLPALLVLGLLAGLSGPALRRRARRLAPA